MAQEIVWQNSLASALTLAKKENKRVLTIFFSQACEPCIKMKQYTLLDESVREYIVKHFIPLKYESGADSEQFLRFDVTAKPTTIVLDSEGNEIFRKIGYFGPELFIENLKGQESVLPGYQLKIRSRDLNKRLENGEG